MDLLIILTYVASEAVVYRFLFQVRRGPYSPYAACPSRAQVGTAWPHPAATVYLCGGEINYGSVDNFDLRGYRLVDI
jgi:hypothetical protein